MKEEERVEERKKHPKIVVYLSLLSVKGSSFIPITKIVGYLSLLHC